MGLLGFLADCSLPVCLADPEDIERVVVLRGTGLIEAEIPPRILGARSYVYSGCAVILSLTPPGLALARRRCSGGGTPEADH